MICSFCGDEAGPGTETYLDPFTFFPVHICARCRIDTWEPTRWEQEARSFMRSPLFLTYRALFLLSSQRRAPE